MRDSPLTAIFAASFFAIFFITLISHFRHFHAAVCRRLLPIHAVDGRRRFAPRRLIRCRLSAICALLTQTIYPAPDPPMMVHYAAIATPPPFTERGAAWPRRAAYRERASAPRSMRPVVRSRRARSARRAASDVKPACSDMCHADAAREKPCACCFGWRELRSPAHFAIFRRAATRSAERHFHLPISAFRMDAAAMPPTP